MDKINCVAPCLMGIEKLLSDELKFLGASDVKAENGRVFFSGDKAMIAKINICSRLAERVYILVSRFDAYTFEDLFQGTTRAPWERYIEKDGEFPVTGRCLSSDLHSVPSCQAIIKKAVVQRLIKHYHTDTLPETGALFKIKFLLMKNNVCIMIDTSGEPLHKRGYRALSNDAPMKETLAAALVELARVRSNHTVIDPCCGSGTILIEAAMKALNIPANGKRSFAAESWSLFPAAIWSEQRKLAEERIKTDSAFKGIGYDIDDNALEICRRNAKLAGVADYITFEHRDIHDFSESFERASVICNPPYGQRLADIETAQEIYKAMGRVFVKKQGFSYTIINPDSDFERCFGRKADKRRKLYNGMISCQVYQFFKKEQ